MNHLRILQPGRNCWRIAHADRVALLVDGAAYFGALRAALARAERAICVLGWDIDSRLQLLRDGAGDGLPARFGDFLEALLARRPALRAYLLSWDFAMIYALERAWVPVFRLNWFSHRRLRFRLDSAHPLGASHHQKLVVIDDRIAFAGGLDITKRRWDTPEHRAHDARRVDPDGENYPPFHDAQMLVDGEAASALGELARERWRRASDEELRAPRLEHASDPWPHGLAPDFERIEVAIARTMPAHDDFEEVREVERLHLDCIAAAERSIYIENQYLTSSKVVAALAERLRARSGPEIVVVLPRETSGWLEKYTMDVLRARAIRTLMQADGHGRLRIVYPDLPDLGERCITVHSKIMVVDDRLLRVGSANLSNRSMGLDSECDLAIEAGDEAQRQAVNACRNRLLAEHLGIAQQDVERALGDCGSLIELLERFSRSGRSLKPLDVSVPEELDRMLPETAAIDPERPIEAQALAREFIGTRDVEPARTAIAIALAVLIGALALAAAWRWTPLREMLEIENLRALVSGLRDSTAAPIVAVAAFVVGGFLVVPVTLLIVVTIMTFGPLPGSAYALIGATASAVASYGIGRALGRDTIRRLAGARLNALSRRFARRGVLAVVAVRILPVAPFTVVNFVAGASHIGVRDFALGSFLGTIPGTVAIAFFVESVAAAIRTPGWREMLALAAVIAAIVATGWAVRRWLRKLAGSAS